MSRTATKGVAPAGPADANAIGAVLARAFEDDPVFGWAIPGTADRRARLHSVFAAFADAYLPYGETYVTGDGAGAALWAPAGVDPLGDERLDAFAARIGAILGDDAARLLEVGALLELHHPPQPFVHLQLMGVVPERQGHGLGSRLLSTVLRRCDATGTPAYLEATSPANRRLYRRYGFETVGEIALPRGPALWRMWREPLTVPEAALAPAHAARAPRRPRPARA
jgi:GNAT superfamily N-acetyltransferase